MKKFNVMVSETALKQLYEIDAKTAESVKSSIKELEENPFRSRPNADIKKLKGSRDPGFYRLRVGDFRVIYTISGNEVRITEIMRRNKGYKWLE